MRGNAGQLLDAEPELRHTSARLRKQPNRTVPPLERLTQNNSY